MRQTIEERLQRLLAIMAAIAGKGPVEMDLLAERYQVSPFQLRKDLTHAQFMGVPPYDLPGETPEITFAGTTVEVWVPSHFAAQPALSRPEAFAVLATGRAALAMNPELKDLASAMEKLDEALAIQGGIDVDIESPTHLDHIRTATLNHRRLAITYWSAWREELTTRLIDPLQVVFLVGEWYTLAYDHASETQRRFRVDRIVECSETDEQFSPPDFEPMTAAFNRPLSAVSVEVRFPESARWVTEYIDLLVTDDSANGFTASLSSVGDRWIERLLLRTGGTVVAPEELVELRQNAAERVLANYNITPEGPVN
ncbi:MAG: WYL domain-containing protein [Actinomycetes bacterium]